MVQILNAGSVTWPLTIPRLMAVDAAGNPVVVSLVLPRVGAPTVTILSEPIPGDDQPAQ